MPGKLTIVPVQSPADLREFIALPRLLYQDMPGFVPPLDHERRMMLDPAKTSFYTHGEGSYWLARQDGRAVGRISAQIDTLATAPACAEAGFFGCLDAIEQPAVVAALVAAAEAWIRARGRRIAQGPYLLSINGESGLLIEGHATPPMIMMPWHPPYLAGLLASAGYRVVRTLRAYSLDLAGRDSAVWQRATARPRRSTELRFRGLHMRALAAEGEILRRLFNEAWSSNWGFAPLAEADMQAMRTGLRPFLASDSGVVAERAGEAVGFMLVLPNVFEIIADLGGVPGPLGWLRFLLRILRKRYRSARVILMGIAPQYHSTPLGAEIAVAMITEMIRRAAGRGITTIEAGWVLDDNTAVIRILEMLGFRPCRTYGIFEKELPVPDGREAG